MSSPPLFRSVCAGCASPAANPCVRKNLPALASRLAALPGLDDLSLSTNAVALARYAEALHEAGIGRINVSLDSLHAARFREITGAGSNKVLDSLMAAKRVGFAPIKINMVAHAGCQRR